MVQKRQFVNEYGSRFSRRGWMLWLAVWLTMVAGATSAYAQFLYRQVNLADLTQRADIIVQGRIIEARYEGHPDYPHLPTVRVTLEVERMLRGPAGKYFTFREFIPGPSVPMGKRSYGVGQRLLLFLPAPSRYGLSNPLAREQGRFHIQRDSLGIDRVANEYGNAGIFKSVPERAQQDGVRLTAEQLRLTSSGSGPVPLSELASLVQHLMLLPRIE